MKPFRESVKNMPDSLFEEMTALLKNHGYEDVKVVSFNLEPLGQADIKCPPGKRPFCRKYASGKVICRCV